jgi:hypothetical protein
MMFAVKKCSQGEGSVIRGDEPNLLAVLKYCPLTPLGTEKSFCTSKQILIEKFKKADTQKTRKIKVQHEIMRGKL